MNERIIYFFLFLFFSTQGQFRDYICGRCNRSKVVQRELVAYGHGSTNYDHAIIFDALMRDETTVRTVYNVICDAGDRYLSISLKFFCDECIKVGRNCQTMEEVDKKSRKVKDNGMNSNELNDVTSSNETCMDASVLQTEREEQLSYDPRNASLEEEIIMVREREDQQAELDDGEPSAKKVCQRNIPPPASCYCKQILGLKLQDSARLLCGPLESLAENLITMCKPEECSLCTVDATCQNCTGLDETSKIFYHTNQMVNEIHGNDSLLSLYTGKSKFPHEAILGVETLEEVTTLPPKSDFFSSLTNNGITENEYLQCQERWKQLQCSNLKDYMVAYLRADVTILCDLVCNFRSCAIKQFDLDPSNYLTLAR